MISIKERKRVHIVGQKWSYFLLHILFVILIAFLYSRNINAFLQNNYEVGISFTDALVLHLNLLIQQPWWYVLLLLMITLSLRNDFLIMYLIRYKNRVELWKEQMRRIVVFATENVTLYIFLVWFLGVGYLQSVYNWNQSGSIFALSQNTILNFGCLLVLFCIVASYFLLNIIVMLLYLLIFWNVKSVAASWLVVLTIFVVEKYIFKTDLLFGFASNNYMYWMEGTIFIRLVVLLVIIFAIYFIGRSLAKSKEFLNEN